MRISSLLGRQNSSPFLVVATLLAAGCSAPADDAEDGIEDIGQELAALPDLVVVDVRSSKAAPVAGDALTFSAVVKNQGTKATPAGTVIRVVFAIDDTQVSFSNTYATALLPGASVTLTANDGPDGDATWRATAGAHVLRARVDNTQRIAESNEDNNVLERPLTVSGSTPTGTKAAPSDAFVESIGVVAHLNWGGTVWDTRFDQYAPILGESGIRYVRTQANAVSIPNMKQLHATYGIRFDVRVDGRKADNTLDPSVIGPSLARLRDDLGADKVVGIEGPNEYNDTKYEHDNTGWATQLRDFQRQLYTTAKADAALRSIPILAPSIWKRYEVDARALGDISAYTDLGCLHYYTGGRKPTVWGGAENPIEDAFALAKINVPDAPMWVTETGYNNKVDTVDSPYSTPEKTQAKYTLRLLGELFKRRASVGKSFLYNLMDTAGTPDKVYGLLRTDMSRKPVFYAIKNANQILSDEGAAFATGSLAHALTGDQTDVVSVVTQKRDGRFFLMIWLDVDSYDRRTGTELSPAPRRLTLDVSSHRFSAMKVYHPTGLGLADPNKGALPIKTVTNPTSVAIDVPDHVMILELDP
jgi:hypothetical protein